MKYLKLALLSALLALSSCSVLKKAETTDKSKITREIERKTITRPADTLVLETKYNVRLKDTTITTTNYETRTVLREIYDVDGNRRTECIAEEINEKFETISEKFHKDIESLKETQHSFDPTPFVWALVGLGIVMLLILVFGIFAINSFKKALPGLVKNIVSDLAKE